MNHSDTATSRNQYFVTGLLIALFYYQAMDYIIFYRLQSNLITWYCHDLLICSEVVLLYFYAVRVEIKPFLLWPEQPRRIWFYPVAIIVLFLSTIVSTTLSRVPGWLKWQEIWDIHPGRHFMHIVVQSYQQNVFICILSTALWGISTELIFRGYLLPRLSIITKSKAVGVIGSSLFYAFFPFVKRGLRSLITDFFNSIIFAVFYLKFRNIKVVIIVRVIIDLIVMLSLREFFLRFAPYILNNYK